METFSRKNWPEIRAIAVILLLLVPCTGVAAKAAAQAPGGITGRVYLDENADTEFRECDCDCGMENIPVRLYRDHCGGLITQTAHTDAEGWFHFDRLEPGPYCLMPTPKFICEGYQPTSSITQKVQVTSGETTEADWFGFDHFLDVKK